MRPLRTAVTRGQHVHITADKDKDGGLAQLERSSESAKIGNSESDVCIAIYKSVSTAYIGPFNLKKYGETKSCIIVSIFNKRRKPRFREVM